MSDPTAMLYDLIALNTQAIDDMRKSLEAYVQEARGKEAENAACRLSMMDSVPNGDHDGHRRYHESIILKMEARTKLWQDISSSVTKWGIIGAIGWLGWAMWHEIIINIASAMGKK